MQNKTKSFLNKNEMQNAIQKYSIDLRFLLNVLYVTFFFHSSILQLHRNKNADYDDFVCTIHFYFQFVLKLTSSTINIISSFIMYALHTK